MDPTEASADWSVAARAPELTPLDEVGDAWTLPGDGPRMTAVLAGARRLRDRLAAGPTVVSVRTLPLASLVYGAGWAYGGAASSPAPFVPLVHRALLVQFRLAPRPGSPTDERVRTLLFNPTDVDRARATPYLAHLAARFGSTLTRWVEGTYEPLEAQLKRLGLSPADVDYIAFDHFHTQDLRGTLGLADGRSSPRFPNARLLSSRTDWNDWTDLHPLQRGFYVADGRQGVNTDAVVLTDGDLSLGDGVMLVRTPGHTRGNQTLFFKTDNGVWGVSENGLSVDNWSPLASRVAGVAAVARALDLPVVPNSNTPSSCADQITAMMLEKTLVDRVPAAPDFCQMAPSSTVVPGLMAPGLAPSYLHLPVEHGVVALPPGAQRLDSRAIAGFGAPPVL